MDPNLGRFWTMDTLEGYQSDPLSLHKFLYVHGNPVNNGDPSGHESLGDVLSSAFIMGNLAATRTCIKSNGEASWGELGSGFAQGFVVGAGLGYAVPWLWGAGVYGRAVVGAGVGVTSALGVGQVVEDISDERYDLAAFDGVLTAGGLQGLSAFHKIPQGFQTPEAFRNFGSKLLSAIRGKGYNDTRAFFQGSSVTGVSYSRKVVFDAGSDYDIALVSPKLLSDARAIGVSLRSGGTRTGPLSPANLTQLGLDGLSSDFSAQAGRKVKFMVFESADVAV